MAMTNTFAIFNNTQITSVPGVTILATNPYNVAKRDLAISPIARTNKRKVTSAFYTKRQITVKVAITGNTREGAERALDALTAILQGQEKELVLSQSGGVRKYYCTLADTVIREGGGAYMEIDLIFECSDHFGYDTAYTIIANLTGQTSSTRQHNKDFEGSAPYQAPVITVKPTAITGGTGASITVGNLSTGQAITVTRDWSANDLLEVDSLNRTVKVNGTEVAYSGAFPEFPKGAGTLYYTDTFTTRTVNTFAYYYRRWL